MNWRNNVCNKDPHNCRKKNNCHDTEECCFERDTPSGHKGNHGLCVAKGSCDFRTGIPTNDAKIPCNSQNYREGYNDVGGTCKNWMWATIILSISLFITLCTVIYMGIKFRNQNR